MSVLTVSILGYTHYIKEPAEWCFILWLFLVFVNDLITELKNTNVGVTISKVNVRSPMFADDLTLLN